MALNSDHLTGFAVGLGAAAFGFYYYKKNQKQVDEFLQEHGIELPSAGVVDVSGMSLKDLVLEKERLEDIIAEREYEMQQQKKKGSKPATTTKNTKKKTTRKKALKTTKP